jgi:CRP-like cAMP-binding protein
MVGDVACCHRSITLHYLPWCTSFALASAAQTPSLATLFNPVLHPRMGDVLRITQQELAYLVGLSRQRVNEALSTLQARGLVRLEYGGLKVLDIAALRTAVFD